MRERQNRGVRFDTIVAPITGSPPAAVAWIRLSGEDAWAIAGQVFRPWPDPVEPRRVSYGRLSNGDDGLALPFDAGHSYTGEVSVELSMHGSRASIDSAIEACLAAGARSAEPGEFTQRAFLHGRIDLTQAEAVRDLTEAQTELQLRHAARNRDGALRREIEAVREAALAQLAAVEASVDFSEEIGEFDREGLTKELRMIRPRLEALRAGAEVSRIVREGYRIVLAGPPNSGKSSLFNRLLGMNRAIVTPIPGTTRDYIEERVDFGGVPVVLVDTAGLRETEDPIEAAGIELSRRAAEGADEVWYVIDAADKIGVDWTFQCPPNRRHLANKVDLISQNDRAELAPCMVVSAKTGEGIPKLAESVRQAVLDRLPPVTINERHRVALDEAMLTIAELEASLKHEGPDDLLSVLLRDLANHLGQITGQTAEADMIERIFHDFCIGK